MTLTGLLPLAKGSSQRGSPSEECLGLEGGSGRHPTACTAGDELLIVSVLLEVSILKHTRLGAPSTRSGGKSRC